MTRQEVCKEVEEIRDRERDKVMSGKMTIREKLKEIADSKITTDRWVCVHNGYGDGRGMFLDELRGGMVLWKDEILNSELTNYTFGVRDGEQCIFLEY